MRPPRHPRKPSVAALALLCASAACGGQGASAPAAGKITCSAPIGPIPAEQCSAVASDFGQLAVGGSVSLAGSGKDAGPKIEAIRAVAALAQSIKDQRVKLCEDYVKCRVPLDEHDAQDKNLSQAYAALFELWNKRRFSSTDEVIRFREAVRALDHRVNGGVEGPAPVLQPPRTVKAEDAFAKVTQPDVAFRASGGAITISATSDRERDALQSKPETLALTAGHRYRITLGGSYAPAVAPVVSPGQRIVVRVKYRAQAAGSLAVALRSLDDPDATDTSETWQTTAGEKGTREVKLAADPGQSGFSVGLSVTGAPVEIEALEVLRDGNVVLAARGGDPATHTDCTAKGAAFTCAAGTGDRITLGAPSAYLVFGVRDATGKRASTRTLSLEGGRSIDAPVGEDGRVTVSLVGAGSATLQQVEVNDLGM